VLNLAVVVKGEGSWAIGAHSLVGKENSCCQLTTIARVISDTKIAGAAHVDLRRGGDLLFNITRVYAMTVGFRRAALAWAARIYCGSPGQCR
tara:strand:- start:21520 stop:21795 length:276 start_codon:yes stop_codon:yes gene_type:complete